MFLPQWQIQLANQTIEMTQTDFLSKVLDRHESHPSVKAIKERHIDNNKFDFKPVDEYE